MSPEEERQLQEDLLLLEEEALRRQQDDPWWKWEPTPKQAPFIHDILTGQTQEAWMMASNRSGKSAAAAFAGASLARFGGQCPRYEARNPLIGDPPTSGWIISVTNNNSLEVIQPKLFNNGLGRDPGQEPFIPPHEIAGWNVTHQILTLKNGSTIGFKSAEQGALKMAGAAKNWVLFDEEPPKNIYEEVVIRVPGSGQHLIVFGACTILPPEGQAGGVSWLFDSKIKPWQRNPDSVLWRIYQSRIYDNPHLAIEELRRLESIYPEGSLSRRIRLEGELLPGIAGNRAYGNFNAQLHVRDLADFSWRRPLCWFWDFNVEPMITGVGQRHGEVFKVYREFVLEDNASIDEMVEMFREAYPTHGGELWIYGDATGRNRNVQTARSEYQLILNAMRGYPMPVRLKVPETNPPVNDRVNAVNASFRDHEGFPRIEIDTSCDQLIADFEGVLFDNRMGIKKVHNRKDPYYHRTHASDAFGYWIVKERPVRLERPDGLIEQIVAKIRRPGYGFRNQ